MKSPVLLIVDDDDGVRHAVSRLLRAHPHLLVSNIEEAKKVLLSEKSIRAVLSDVMMPEGTGLDLFEWAKTKLPAMADRFIFMTGGAPNEILARLRAGALVLDKPVDAQELRQAVQERIGSGDESGGRATPA